MLCCSWPGITAKARREISEKGHRLLLVLEMYYTGVKVLTFHEFDMNSNYLARPGPKGYEDAEKLPLDNQKIMTERLPLSTTESH